MNARILSVSLLYLGIATAIIAQGEAPAPSLLDPSTRELPPGEAGDGSLYDLESEWRSQDDQAVKFSDLKGKIRIVAMGYTSCQFACPRILADLKRIEMELTDAEKESGKIAFSFISIDPEVDTPERMKELENDYAFNGKRWLLLTGDEDGVLELSVVLGMKYRKTSALDFAHSNIITVLAADGRIVHQSNKIGDDISLTLEAIREELVKIP